MSSVAPAAFSASTIIETAAKCVGISGRVDSGFSGYAFSRRCPLRSEISAVIASASARITLRLDRYHLNDNQHSLAWDKSGTLAEIPEARAFVPDLDALVIKSDEITREFVPPIGNFAPAITRFCRNGPNAPFIEGIIFEGIREWDASRRIPESLSEYARRNQDGGGSYEGSSSRRSALRSRDLNVEWRSRVLTVRKADDAAEREGRKMELKRNRFIIKERGSE